MLNVIGIIGAVASQKGPRLAATRANLFGSRPVVSDVRTILEGAVGIANGTHEQNSRRGPVPHCRGLRRTEPRRRRCGVGKRSHASSIAEVGGQADAIDIKDAVYDGDIVIADITRLRTEDSTVEHIIDELRQVAREVDGDIVRKGDDQMIITPTGVRVSREKIGQSL